jgi:hypothetical protein
MEILWEQTDWSKAGTHIPNHIYVLDSAGKLKAFMNTNSGDWKVFTKPLFFNKSRRKFAVVDLPIPPECNEELPAGAKEVKDSNGMTYIVHNGTCTCPGYKFRRKCRHTS